MPTLWKYFKAIFSGDLLSFLTYGEMHAVEGFRIFGGIFFGALLVNILLSYIYNCTNTSKRSNHQ